MSNPCLNQPLDDFDATQNHPVGYQINLGGQIFRYVYNAGADTLAVGDFVCFSTNSTYGNISGTVATCMHNGTAGVAAGVAQSAATTATYLWVQTGGKGRKALVTDGGVAEGDGLVINGGTSPDDTVDTMADGEEECVCGWALDADTGSAQPAGAYTVATEKNW